MAQNKQKRPEQAVSAQGELTCPWFHLNSCLADTHFVPGNGGGPAGHFLPALQRGLPTPPSKDSHRPSSLLRPGEVLFSVSAFGDIVIYKTQVVKGQLSCRTPEFIHIFAKNVDKSSEFLLSATASSSQRLL